MKTCSSPQELSNGVLHLTCMHRGRVDSRLLMVRSQTANLTPDLSFNHNLCCRCPNGPCEAIFDIYTSLTFQWYKEHPNARCFDPWNWTLKFQESRRLPKSQFRECEFHPHTSLKTRFQHLYPSNLLYHILFNQMNYMNIAIHKCTRYYPWKKIKINYII
jgi:hypothetical protein